MSFVPDTNIDGTSPIINPMSGGGGGGTITIGTTVIPVGGITSTLEGLSSVTSTIFVGNLNGTATLSDRNLVAHSTANDEDYITFVTVRSGSAQTFTSDALRYNPSTGILTVGTISSVGNLSLLPGGNVQLNSREILSAGTIRSAANLILTAPTSGAPLVTTTPDRIDLGSTIGDTDLPLKVLIFNSGSDRRGIGAFGSAQTYRAPIHSFFNTVREQIRIDDILIVRPGVNDVIHCIPVHLTPVLAAALITPYLVLVMY